MFQAVNAVGDGVLGSVRSQVSGDDESAAMSFLDDRLADRALRTGVDLQRGHLPTHHFLDKRGNLGRIGDGAARIAVNRRLAVDQRTAGENARPAVRVRGGEVSHTRQSHNLVSGAANGSDTRRQEQRQYLVAGKAGEVEHVDEVYVSVDQSGNYVFPSDVERTDAGWNCWSLGRRANERDPLASDENVDVREHAPHVRHRTPIRRGVPT